MKRLQGVLLFATFLLIEQSNYGSQQPENNLLDKTNDAKQVTNNQQSADTEKPEN